jgi:hypothetical protein
MVRSVVRGAVFRAGERCTSAGDSRNAFHSRLAPAVGDPNGIRLDESGTVCGWAITGSPDERNSHGARSKRAAERRYAVAGQGEVTEGGNSEGLGSTFGRVTRENVVAMAACRHHEPSWTTEFHATAELAESSRGREAG